MRTRTLRRELRAFAPTVERLDGGRTWLDWSGFAELVDRAFSSTPHAFVDDVLQIFERHPLEDDEHLWSALHEIEALLGHERALIASFRRAPTTFTAMMLLRIANVGVFRVGRFDLVASMVDASRDLRLPEPLRESIARDVEIAGSRERAWRQAAPLSVEEAVSSLHAVDRADQRAWRAAIEALHRAGPDRRTVLSLLERYPAEDHHAWTSLLLGVEAGRRHGSSALASFRRQPSCGTAFLIARLAVAGDPRAIEEVRSALRSRRTSPEIRRTIASFWRPSIARAAARSSVRAHAPARSPGRVRSTRSRSD